MSIGLLLCGSVFIKDKKKIYI